MIDHSTVDALHNGCRRVVLQDIVLDSIVPQRGKGGVLLGWLTTFHNVSDGMARAAFFNQQQVRDEGLPCWCMMMSD